MKHSVAFVLGALFFVACGAAEIKFPYKFFHVSPTGVWKAEGGQLLGDGIRYQLTECSPVRDDQGKMVQRCVVLFYDELNKLVKDYKETKQRLIDCEKGSK